MPATPSPTNDPAQRARWRTSWISLATALVGHGLTLALLPLFLGWTAECLEFALWGVVIGLAAFGVTLIAWVWSRRRARSLDVHMVGWTRFLIATISGLVWVLYMPHEINGFVAIALPVSVVRIVGLTPPVTPFVIYTSLWSAAFLLLSDPFGIDETVYMFFVAIWTGSTAVFFLNTRRLRRELHRKNRELEAVHAELESLIDERSRQVDDLAAQLQHKVKERSHALAKALDGVTRIELKIGDVIDDRVEVVRMLGRGGMGSVYLAQDRLTDRPVAVKVMVPGLSDVAAIRRFLDEAEVVSRVDDPAIVRTLHVDVTEEGLLYQLMEYVDGAPLDRRLAGGKGYAPGAAARIGAEIARALAVAHAHGIVHRDIKPANIMLTRIAPGVRILDFGISKLLTGEREAVASSARQMLGTPAYMSPEQIRDAAEVSTATDVYSLGVVLFEMLVGRLPFTGKTAADLYAAHLEQPPRYPRDEAGVPESIAALIERCLDKIATVRPSADYVQATLAAWADELHAPAVDVINRAATESARGGDDIEHAPTVGS